MSVTISNPWWHIGAGMLLPLYVLFLLAKRRLNACSREHQNQQSTQTLLLYFRNLRWHVLVLVLAFGIVVAIVVAPHRLFVAIETTDTEVVLDYPWPRYDVHLRLEDICEANVESSRFGLWGRTMFRLRLTSPTADYCSPWSSDDTEVRRACDAIQAQLKKP